MTTAPGTIVEAVLSAVARIPDTSQHAEVSPLLAAQALTRAAATKAALTSGSLALAPGPIGLLTLLPDLIAVWKIQSQLVSDIAAVYGRKAELTREHMLYCLFKHTASQALRDLMVRAGERYVFKRASLAALEKIAKKIGLVTTKKLMGSAGSRFLPLVGAVGVGAYAYYDTVKVAATAIALFEKDIVS
jgi:hypothetical protein